MTSNYPTRITKLSITNFRCFEHVEMDFGNLTALTGDSGTGKTSLITAVAFLAHVARDGLEKTVATFGGYERLVHRFGDSVTIQVSGCFTDAATIHQPDTYSLSFAELQRGVLLREEDWQYPTNETADGEGSMGGFTAESGSGVIAYRHPEGSKTEGRDPRMTGLHVLSQFRGTTGAEVGKLAKVLSAVQHVAVNPATANGSMLQETPIYLDPDQTYPVPALHNNADNLNEVLHALRGSHQSVSNSIFADLQRCYPWIRGFHGKERDAHVSVVLEECGLVNVPIKHASPGVVSMFALLTALRHPYPAPITILDNLGGLGEIETQVLVAAMKDAAKRTQVIALGSPTNFNPYAEDFDVYRIAERGYSGEITWSQ